MYTREELNNLSGSDIKDILREMNVNIPGINRKPENIELILKVQEEAIILQNHGSTNDEIATTTEEDYSVKNKEEVSRLNLSDAKKLYNECIVNGSIKKIEDINISKATLYENSPITYNDQFTIEKEHSFYEGLVLLINSENEVCAKGHLTSNDEEYYILLSSNDVIYDKFAKNIKYKLITFSKEAKDYLDTKKSSYKTDKFETFEINCTIYYKEMDTTERPLCIDFGTSNTTIGSYGILGDENDIELVEFTDYTKNPYEQSNVYPTLVYVKDCSGDKVDYLFGYDAKKKIIEQDYDTKASTFLEIKRWINNLDYIEEIFDEEENTKKVTRREIVQSYILHILDLAQQYFKKKFKRLHFSAPIKLKDYFNNEMKNILPNYTVLKSEKSLDEGISIIYNHISNIMDIHKNIPEDVNTNIMIVDCGGGTTDLASCNYNYSKTDAGYDLNINTQFENGNSNFGGNNITYRIFQFLKLKFASSMGDNCIESEINNLIPFNENEILSRVDNKDEKTNIYSELEKQYNLSEKVIPTKFADTKTYKYEKQQRNIKRNFHYLWQLAEKIKIEFYKKTDLLSVNFLEDKGDSKNIMMKDTSTFYFYTFNKETTKLEKQDKIPDITVNIKEITTLLYADIYGLLNNLLGDIKPEDYNNYKLSGQSCKITLFNQLFKEFVPGKKLRSSSNNSSETLKLECIKGSIAYIKDKQSGKINPVIKSKTPKIIYDVFINRGEKIKVLDGSNLIVNPQFFKNSASTINFEVYNFNGELEQKLEYDIKFKQNTRLSLLEIKKDIISNSIINENRLDEIIDLVEEFEVNDGIVISIFTVPAKDNYGFYIYQVAKENIENGYKYLMANPVYKNFEGNVSSETFFNGLR